MYYNNSLVSFDWDPVYGYNADMKVFYESVANENVIADLKLNHRPVTDNIVNNVV